MWGARDDVLTREHQESPAAAVPGSRLVVHEDTGHLVRSECPERAAADLVTFPDGLGR